MPEWVIVSIVISHLLPIFALQPPSGEYAICLVEIYFRLTAHKSSYTLSVSLSNRN